jgi:hypothetical protein
MKMQHLEISDQLRNCVIFILISLPILSLILNAVSWLKLGVDIPFFDDWRTIERNQIGDLSWSYLFTSANDTHYAVGKALDSLADRYLNGNAIAYQFISMIGVLGTLLFLQWRLLYLALNDKLLAASAFSFTLVMLVPNSYWGMTNMGYHQALPLVFILTALYLVLGVRWNQWLSPIILMMLGLLAGFTYISGAFSTLIVSIVFITASYFIQISDRKPLLQGGLALLLASLVTVFAQIYVLAIIQKGTHRPDAPMAYPFESDFWLFFLGKVGRALMLPAYTPVFSLIVTSMVVTIIVTLAIFLVKQFKKSRTNTLLKSKLIIIYITLSSFLFVYLCLVCAGRANFGLLTSASPTEIFSYAFNGFHFFWITLLWPWLIAVILVIANNIVLKKIQLSHILAMMIPLFIIPILIIRGAFKHEAYYNLLMEQRVEGVRCLITQVENNENINCPNLYVYDLTPAFLYAKEYGLSFTRTIPPAHIPIEKELIK